ncbi:penicillin-insensitive murein endopeptidase [Lishizhenia tianjinensis]|uniref:Penicillin-insensitive murein endopeptidase n=1 Tax=Lishizhenia tianjinensis TaxID=477690 RepID=A0A1I6XQU6_9FLAO|nr:penicillin-insensitive murein endopeptidase [Lishizhenia tianjinensis]SFT40758.1 penicillin-insensitive murein endopeptidase [Lishizhenia tianjinensis]
MKRLPSILLGLLIFGCTETSETEVIYLTDKQNDTCNTCAFSLVDYYSINSLDTLPSTYTGTPANGSLNHAKILPPKGKNFFYFDSTSYLKDRAFTHSDIRDIVLNTYANLDVIYPGRIFSIMEASNKKGGKMDPHRTHQNGMSVDFMFPKLKNGVPYHHLDTLGFLHYLLDFDENGRYTKDTTISIDFETSTHHIYLLALEAEKLNYAIEKVLIYTEYKDELFRTTYGKKLKQKGIYFAQYLTPKINNLHDDHYHIDFKAK